MVPVAELSTVADILRPRPGNVARFLFASVRRVAIMALPAILGDSDLGRQIERRATERETIGNDYCRHELSRDRRQASRF